MQIGKFIGLGILGLSLSFSLSSSVFADGSDATLIHGCVAKDGTTRIVTPATTCKNSETPRHWPTDARIIADETRITNTETTNTNQNTAITAIQTKNTQQDADIAALQGQVGGGSSGLVVKDSLGATMGTFVEHDKIVIKIGTESLLLFLNASGFINNGEVFFFHTTNDCTGTRYTYSERSNEGAFLNGISSFDGQTGYYATEPAQQLLMQTRETVRSAQELQGMGSCTAPFGPTPLFVTLPTVVNFNTLGTPPFHLE